MPRALSARRSQVALIALSALVACLLYAQSAAAATSTIGGPGVGNATFDVPGADGVDSTGDLYVLDTHRGTVQKFANTGGFIAALTGTVNGASLPTDSLGGLAVDASDNVWIADDQNQPLIEL